MTNLYPADLCLLEAHHSGETAGCAAGEGEPQLEAARPVTGRQHLVERVLSNLLQLDDYKVTNIFTSTEVESQCCRLHLTRFPNLYKVQHSRHSSPCRAQYLSLSSSLAAVLLPARSTTE